MKTCSKCEKEQPLDEFRKWTHANGKTYQRRSCRTCDRATNRALYRKNREEGRLAYAKEYRKKNRAKTASREKAYRQERHDEYLAHYRRRYWADPEKHREYARRRRMALRGIEPGDYTKQELLDRDGAWCYICERDLIPTDVTIDHVIPLSKGGTDSLDNVRIACFGCNFHKRDRE